MGKNIFIAATEPNSGKSAISIGLIEAFESIVPKVGYIKPIGQRYHENSDRDSDAQLIKDIFQLENRLEDINPVSIEDIQKNKDVAYDKIIESYKRIAEVKDIVVIEGTDYTSVTNVLEFDINAELAKDLNAPVLLIANGSEKSVEEIILNVTNCRDSFHETGCEFLGVVINGLKSTTYEENALDIKEMAEKANIPLFGILPYLPSLGKPKLGEVAKKLNARILYAGDDLSRVVIEPRVFAMKLEHALGRLRDKDGYLIIAPGDKADIIGMLESHRVKEFPRLSGLILTGGLQPGENTMELIKVSNISISILSVDDDTYNTALKVSEIAGEITQNDTEKIRLAKLMVDSYVDTKKIYEQLGLKKADIRTPKMFMYELLDRARSDKKRIVLPEGTGERVLRAATRILNRGVCDITLLGHRDSIRVTAGRIGSRVKQTIKEKATIIDPAHFNELDEYIDTFYQMRKHKGITEDRARDIMMDPHYLATMMVYKGAADGFVSGTEHSTAATIRPVLQLIKTKEGVSIASSIFFMSLPDRVLVYGDCALVENPNAEELADIAITSAETARTFGVDPYVAMLSYSTGESGKGKDVDKVRKATEIARKRKPDLPIEGPIQYDAAISPDVARIKVKDSEVAGKATVYIFPDLDSGNIAYKAVQRSANIAAIGPVLQGVNKPANDLSRGATVEDIVYTIAITAIQAQHP